MGQAVRERRRALSLTQGQLVMQSGLSRATLSALENGQLAELGVNRLLRLLGALGLTLTVELAPTYRPTMDELSAMNAQKAPPARERYRG